MGGAPLSVTLSVMIKVIASWILLVVGTLLSAGALVVLSMYAYRELRMRFGPHTLLIGESRPTVPDFVGTQVLGIPYTFWTTAWASVIGQLGIGLILVALGLHLRHLHRLDDGRERLQKQQQIEVQDGGHP